YVSYCIDDILTVLLFRYTALLHVYPLSLHDALPILGWSYNVFRAYGTMEYLSRKKLMTKFLGQSQEFFEKNSTGSLMGKSTNDRSEEHTSELQSRFDLVCRLLLEKKKQNKLQTKPVN